MTKTEFNEVCEAFDCLPNIDYKIISKEDLIKDIMKDRNSFKNKENLMCEFSIQVFKYYAEKYSKCEEAYKNAYYILSSAGIVSCDILNDVLEITALDPAAILVFNTHTGRPELYSYIDKYFKETYNLGIKVLPYKDTSIYNCTKPFLQNNHSMILDGVLSWEEAFEIKKPEHSKDTKPAADDKMVCKEGWSWSKFTSCPSGRALELKGFIPVERIDRNCCRFPMWVDSSKEEFIKEATWFSGELQKHEDGWYKHEGGCYIKYRHTHCTHCGKEYFAVLEIGDWENK